MLLDERAGQTCGTCRGRCQRTDTLRALAAAAASPTPRAGTGATPPRAGDALSGARSKQQSGSTVRSREVAAGSYLHWCGCDCATLAADRKVRRASSRRPPDSSAPPTRSSQDAAYKRVRARAKGGPGKGRVWHGADACARGRVHVPIGPPTALPAAGCSAHTSHRHTGAGCGCPARGAAGPGLYRPLSPTRHYAKISVQRARARA